MTTAVRRAATYRESINWPAADVDEHIQRAIRWHFSPETGSKFWLEKARSLDFDPRAEVKTRRDLFRFPDVSAEWKDAPVEALVPAHMSAFGVVPNIYESGGTTGAPNPESVDELAGHRVS